MQPREEEVDHFLGVSTQTLRSYRLLRKLEHRDMTADQDVKINSVMQFGTKSG